MTIDTDYLGSREQVRDFNYELRHRGRKTECEIDANGVLTGTSKKVYRGTIDLVHGCKGATGTERETVLLANKGVDNKTVPVILCDEDDVAGNHGATIGHVRDEQLFYPPAAASTKTPPRICSSAPSWRTLRFPPPMSAPAPPSSAWATT
ncbi:MAG: SufB/SufD family protein [Collinsella sp.]